MQTLVIALICTVGVGCTMANGSADMSVREVVERYVEARGGRARLESIRTRRYVDVERRSDGRVITTTVTGAAPNKELVVATIAGLGEDFRSVCDGVRASAVIHGKVVSLTTAEQSQLCVDSEMFPELRFDQLFPEASVAGIVEFQQKQCYKVFATSRSGSSRIMYFDVKTGLLSGYVYGTYMSIRVFSDYRDFDGIQYATLSTSTDGSNTGETVLQEVVHNPTVSSAAFNISAASSPN
jgi:hypothetical protein